MAEIERLIVKYSFPVTDSGKTSDNRVGASLDFACSGSSSDSRITHCATNRSLART
jgi:hypothetical protein